GAGPEGLPHSIIVTAEGVEGEVDLAARVQADAAPVPVEPNPLGDTAPIAKEAKGQGKKATSAKANGAKRLKGKAVQMPLFNPSDRPAKPDKRDKRDKPNKPVPASKPRGKK
ncbi:MAG: hypothetical protein HP493_10120, partial [Nitrospira sp.]|nr:hypothetical protein [Nitrospira sp.]